MSKSSWCFVKWVLIFVFSLYLVSQLGIKAENPSQQIPAYLLVLFEAILLAIAFGVGKAIFDANSWQAILGKVVLLAGLLIVLFVFVGISNIVRTGMH